MKTRSFMMQDSHPNGERILAHFAFFRDDTKAGVSESIAGAFINKPIESEDLITGIYGSFLRNSAAMVIHANEANRFEGVGIVTLSVEVPRTDNIDITEFSIIEVDKLTSKTKAQLTQLLAGWLESTGRVFNVEDSLSDLIYKNNQFVPYVFERLHKLVAFKYMSDTINLPETTSHVVTIHTNRGAKIAGHGPLGTLLRTSVYI